MKEVIITMEIICNKCVWHKLGACDCVPYDIACDNSFYDVNNEIKIPYTKIELEYKLTYNHNGITSSDIHRIELTDVVDFPEYVKEYLLKFYKLGWESHIDEEWSKVYDWFNHYIQAINECECLQVDVINIKGHTTHIVDTIYNLED